MVIPGSRDRHRSQLKKRGAVSRLGVRNALVGQRRKENNRYRPVIADQMFRDLSSLRRGYNERMRLDTIEHHYCELYCTRIQEDDVESYRRDG
jgi:hypothetical protein